MAEAQTRVGVIRVSVHGDWDIEDLLALAESLAESYGLFYPLVAHDDLVRERLQDTLRKQFWSGDIETRQFGRYLYRSIPREDSLKIRSFHYSSPGALELAGVLVALLLAARVARAWLAVGTDFISFWEKIEKFFEKKKHLRRPKRRITLDSDMAISSDEARKLVFEVGEKLGFDALSCDKLIEIVGNPISALKYIVAAGNEGRKLATLEQQGLLRLPAPTGEAIVLQSSGKESRRRPKVSADAVRKGLGKKPEK
jgi:hypothetical protein